MTAGVVAGAGGISSVLSETSSAGGGCLSEDEEAGSSHSQGRKSQDSRDSDGDTDGSQRQTATPTFATLAHPEELLRKPLLVGFRRETVIK